MRTRSILAAALSVAAVAVGCQQERPAPSRPPAEHVHDDDPDMLPGTVKAGFDRAFPDADIKDVDKQTHPDGTIHWDVTFTTKAGDVQKAEFDRDGKLLRRY